MTTTTAASSPARGGARRASTGSAVATPSRHLDFRGVSQDVDEDDESDDARVRRRPPRVSFSSVVEEEPVRARRERAWSDDDAYSAAGRQARGQLSPGGTRSRRRKVVHWTKREEQFIIQGVKNYGLGHWAKILEDGQGVFHHQRTNVDIKDKWKNLLRKVALTPEEEEIVDTRIWRETVAARMIERMLPTLRHRAGEASGADESGDSLDGSGDGGNARVDTPPRAKRRRLAQGSPDAIQFFIGTDASAPHLRAVTVTPRECPTIAALKRVLSRQLLEDLPLSTNLRLVSIHTRRLLGDLEAVEDCAERDGRELYLLYDP